MRNINTLLIFSILIITFLISSCDDDGYKTIPSENDVNCFDCYAEKPDLMPIELVFNPINQDDVINFTVYSGNAFTSAIYLTGDTHFQTIRIDVKPDQKYTIVAVYNRNGTKYNVINDCYPKMKYFKNVCDEPCYYPNSIKCDLNLKY